MRRAIGVQMVKDIGRNTEFLDKLVEKRGITNNLKDYHCRLMAVDFAIWEARSYAQQRLKQKIFDSIVVDREFLSDDISMEFMSTVNGTDHTTVTDERRSLFEIDSFRYTEATDNINKI